MKHYQVETSMQARNDLLEIWDYICTELHNPDAAERLLADIKREMYSLSTMPARNRIIDLEPWKSQGVRKVRIKNFYIYYIIQEEAAKVSITTVTYVGRDQKNALSQPDSP